MLYAWNQHKRAINSNLSMLDLINEERKNKVEKNCVYIKTFLIGEKPISHQKKRTSACECVFNTCS